jgi:crossover junction endodeoxyribonuclease RuvC
MMACGVLRNKERSPIGERLRFLYRELTEIIEKHRPDAVAIEQPFVAKNARSALAIGRAQSIAILAAANQNIPIHEYTPTEVKQKVADYGGSSKEQVQEMVRLQLCLEEASRSSDAADALAVALCHLHEVRLQGLLARGQ